MGRMSREKGKRGEREIARILRDHGYKARRGEQYCGSSGDADVIGLPGIHIEVKRTERLRLYDSLIQSRQDARCDEIPVVFHRSNDCRWVAILDLDDFINLYSETDLPDSLREERIQVD